MRMHAGLLGLEVVDRIAFEPTTAAPPYRQRLADDRAVLEIVERAP